MAEQCKGTLYVPQGARCVRRTNHPSGYCHDHRHQQVEPGEKAREIVAEYFRDINLMSTSQGDGYRSANYTDAQVIAQLAHDAGRREQAIPYAAGPDETRVRAVRMYDDGIRAFNMYPPQDGGNAHHSAVMGVYEVGFLDGIKQAQKEIRQRVTPEALAEALCDAMPHPGGGSLLVYEDALEAAHKVLGGRS